MHMLPASCVCCKGVTIWALAHGQDRTRHSLGLWTATPAASGCVMSTAGTQGGNTCHTSTVHRRVLVPSLTPRDLSAGSALHTLCGRRLHTQCATHCMSRSLHHVRVCTAHGLSKAYHLHVGGTHRALTSATRPSPAPSDRTCAVQRCHVRQLHGRVFWLVMQPSIQQPLQLLVGHHLQTATVAVLHCSVGLPAHPAKWPTTYSCFHSECLPWRVCIQLHDRKNPPPAHPHDFIGPLQNAVYPQVPAVTLHRVVPAAPAAAAAVSRGAMEGWCWLVSG